MNLSQDEVLGDFEERSREVFEPAYLAATQDWKGSGMSGPFPRWEALRKPVADAVDSSGSFLDIGCANGYLLQCLISWLESRGIQIEPYGLDLSKKILELAKRRFPDYKSRFFQANSMTFIPDQKFDWVRTEIVYVPEGYERKYILHLLDHYVKQGGKLLVCNYVEDHKDPGSTVIQGSRAFPDLKERLGELGFEGDQYFDGFDEVKGRKTRITRLCFPVDGISPVPARFTYALRHRILRPHQKLNEMEYPGDYANQSLHLAMYQASRVVGVASFLDEGVQGELRLRGMAVDRELQGQGLGSKLLLHGLTILKKQGIEKVWCNARTTAMKFYLRHHFQITGDEFELPGIGPHYKAEISLR